ALVALPVGIAMLVAEEFFLKGKSTRVASVVIFAGFFTFMLALNLYNHHTYLLAIVAAIFAVNTHVTLLLKVQMSVVYFYAAVTKINETYLSGTELYASVVGRPFWDVFIGVDPAPWVLIA